MELFIIWYTAADERIKNFIKMNLIECNSILTVSRQNIQTTFLFLRIFGAQICQWMKLKGRERELAVQIYNGSHTQT